MPEVLPSNGLSSTLTLPVTDTDTVLSIQTADSIHWPAAGNYRAVLWQDPALGPWELVMVTSGQGTASLGVQRAAEAYNGSQTAHAWPSGTEIAAVVTHDGLDSRLYFTMRVDEFVPVAGTNVVTLTRTPEQVVMVARAGLVQSQAAGDYVVSVNTLTFATGFTGNERVIVSYSVRGP